MSTNSTNGKSRKGTLKDTSSSETEVLPAKAKRRRYTAKQKLKILEEIDSLEHGQLGSYLRKKGIYSASISTWRKQRDDGTLSTKGSPKRGRPGKSNEAKELEKLRRENEKLKKKLEQADMIIDAQKKLCEIYGQSPQKNESR